MARKKKAFSPEDYRRVLSAQIAQSRGEAPEEPEQPEKTPDTSGDEPEGKPEEERSGEREVVGTPASETEGTEEVETEIEEAADEGISMEDLQKQIKFHKSRADREAYLRKRAEQNEDRALRAVELVNKQLEQSGMYAGRNQSPQYGPGQTVNPDDFDLTDPQGVQKFMDTVRTVARQEAQQTARSEFGAVKSNMEVQDFLRDHKEYGEADVETMLSKYSKRGITLEDMHKLEMLEQVGAISVTKPTTPKRTIREVLEAPESPPTLVGAHGKRGKVEEPGFEESYPEKIREELKKGRTPFDNPPKE